MDDLLRSILDPGEMTFTIEDADMDKLYEVLSDINIKDCPYFEIRDKYGNFAKYYREDQPVCKKGKWKWSEDNASWCCSVCGCVFEEIDWKPEYNFCPNCGIRMEI